MENGEGPLVMFRADMDGLPVEEKSGLSYASQAKQIDPNGDEVFVIRLWSRCAYHESRGDG